MKEYKFVKFLGKGTYGEIYLAQKGNNPQLYAAKAMDKKRMDSPKLKKYFEGEISIMKKLNHPNIVKFYEKLEDDTNYYLIIEYCNGGSLSENVMKYLSKNNNEPFSIEIIQNFMREIISAFCHIHSKGIIHRDIKLGNILLSYDNEKDKKEMNLMKAKVKIIDFGVATEVSPGEYAHTIVGSPTTMDPSILAKYSKAERYEKLQGYNEKADVWSLGVIFFQLLTGQGMFQVGSMKELMKKVEKGTYSVPINKNFSKEAVSFLNCMLQYDPEDRVSVHNLAQHDFIHNNVKDFTQANFEKIFHKIDKNRLNINVKKDMTIYKEFTTEKAVLNQLKNKSANLPDKNPLKKANTFKEEPYIFKGDIYGKNQRSSNRKNSENVPDINNPFIQKNDNNPKIAKKNSSDINIPIVSDNKIKDLEKFEECLTETIRIGNGDDEEKKTITERQEEKKEEKIIKGKDKNEKEETINYLQGLLEEYNSVKEYFNKNGLTKQEQDANEKYNLIKTYLQSFEKGNDINFETLPKPINPEYIYNSTIAERNSIFKEIIDHYTENRNDLEASIRHSIIKYKKMDVNRFHLLKNDVMTKLKSERMKLEKYKNDIELLQNRYNDIWVPAPEISRSIEFGKRERITFEGCVYKLTIHTTKKNYFNTNSRFFIRFNMKINENKNYYGEVNILSYGDYENDIIWDLKESEWSNLSNYFMNVDFYFDQVLKGNQKINISKLKTDHQMKISYPITFPNQSKNTIINFEIKIEIPEGKKITLNGKREIINVNKIFPAFEGKSPYTKQIPSLFSKKI